MQDKLLTMRETMALLKVSKVTLQRWDNEGKLKAVRTHGGHRRYRESDINEIISIKNSKYETNEQVVAVYARCSSQEQKTSGDLDRQALRIFEHCVSHNYKVGHIIKDIGSGLNDKRKGFVKLCNLVKDKHINKVVIEHKDRLTRFQYNLIELFFNSYGVTIELVDKKDCSEQVDLVNDMMMLIASFSGKLYSMRARENRVKRKSLKQTQINNINSKDK